LVTRPHLEFLAELNNQSFSQNEEWFAEDLRVYYRPKECVMSIGTDGNKTVQMTFDSGSTWVDFDFINFRSTDGSGITVQHMHIYFKEF
jgi:hypothetical protein